MRSSACGELACPELVEGVESGVRKCGNAKVQHRHLACVLASLVSLQ